MKKGWILFVSFTFVLAITACKKKDEPGKSGAAVKESAAQAAASAEKELGVKPRIHVAVNMASVKNSPLYSMFKDKIEAQLGKDCSKKIVDAMESVVVLGDPEGLAGKKEEGGEARKNENLYMVMKGASAKDAIACMKESTEMKDKIKDAKLSGVDVLSFEKDGQTSYLWPAGDKTVVMVSGKWSEKIKPNEGTLGKGEIPSMAGGKSIAFSVADVDEVKEAAGTVDLAKGLMADVSVTLKEESKAKMAEEQFQQAKKQADQIPIPGVADIVKSIKFSRNGATIGVQVTISADQLKQLAEMAKGMGGGFPM